MKHIIILSAFLLASPAVADSLDDGAAICAKYKNAPMQGALPTHANPNPAQAPEYAAGWSHCAAIAAARKARDDAAATADEAQNPELKATRALAKTLGKQP